MTFLEYIGATVVGLVLLFLCIVLLEIVGNIYGGIRGAYRLREILHRAGKTKTGHWRTIRLGMKAWSGCRYRDGLGHYFYFSVGGIIVPVDGRDPITHERYPG